ncbi:DHHA1 domain-containing protein [Vibrio brasiliensis]|uniref:DHHA1 domain-containing protein n=1 Tax=Vibrio brasiliensis TaxID=170652 RepID=UPI001EFDD4C6|nr:DHHA1 domain-containing protein [Vibrio brasiliensis]MCG9723777.1 DHHA1 domain-containing protein [Vibrio brasiliensis]
MHYDVFNGDADGILSLIQLRKYEPKSSTLITGVKRDIKLLKKVATKKNVSGVTALDISMEKNLDALHELLDRDIPVFYCDHHRTGEVPQADNFTALINLDAQICTSLLINKHIGGRYVYWAIVGAFGDNLNAQAEALAQECDLQVEQTEFLKELGVLINYNGYGASLSDLHIEPAQLFVQLMQYESPFDLLTDTNSPYYLLKRGYESDASKLETLEASFTTLSTEVYVLPCQAWARRVSGVFGNQLANQSPSKAHAVFTLNENGEDYTVSVRAPLENRTGADEVCSQFATGGGRKAAAGINQLPKSEVENFVQALNQFYKK